MFELGYKFPATLLLFFSFVAPLGGDQKLLGRERGMERRRNLDASLNAIYKDLYERTLKISWRVIEAFR